ncbi:MAG: hypothetical protein BVN32_10265 [Proteobacteria bacterium ST_bin14]|nr:MAG: hypothetical protein BVN32_10265 [Proteobacteria bacterium ST_bin14]
MPALDDAPVTATALLLLVILTAGLLSSAATCPLACSVRKIELMVEFKRNGGDDSTMKAMSAPVDNVSRHWAT